MNKVYLSGRITRDPEVRYANNGNSVAKFSVACDRKYSKEKETDFISCVAFNKTAEFIEKYFHKGDGIEIDGRIQTGSYEKDGRTVYTTDVVVNEVDFPKGKAGGASTPKETPSNVGDGFVNIPDGVDDSELPFN